MKIKIKQTVEIEAVTGKRVHVAKAGLTIENFNINPF